MRIFFSGFADDETLLPLLAESIAQEQGELAAVEAILVFAQQQVAALTDPAEQRIGFFQMLTIERAILHHQAQIDWLGSIMTPSTKSRPHNQLKIRRLRGLRRFFGSFGLKRDRVILNEVKNPVPLGCFVSLSMTRVKTLCVQNPWLS